MSKAITLIALLMLVAGCRTEPEAATARGDFPTRTTYSVPPKQIYERVKQVVTSPPINLPIESERDGRMVTGWQSNAGAHVTAGGVISRDWQERTRYTITVTPAWDDPNKSTIEITEESQQRPHDAYDWGSQAEIKRPARAAQLAKQIDEALAAKR